MLTKTIRLSTHLYEKVCFDRRVQFERYQVRQFWSKKLIFICTKCLLRRPRVIEVRPIDILVMTLVKPVHKESLNNKLFA